MYVQTSSQARKTTSTEADNVTSKQEQQVPLPRSSPTSDSPSQWVSALPQDGSVEGEVQLLVSSFRGASHACMSPLPYENKHEKQHRLKRTMSPAKARAASAIATILSHIRQPVAMGISTAARRLSGRRSTIACVILWGASLACMSILPYEYKHEKQHRLKRNQQAREASALANIHGPSQSVSALPQRRPRGRGSTIARVFLSRGLSCVRSQAITTCLKFPGSRAR